MFGVARSNLIKRVNGQTKARTAYTKVDDTTLLAVINALLSMRLTYGYKRVTAMLKAIFAGARMALRSVVEHLVSDDICNLMSETVVFAPHKGLKMMSPREFRKKVSA